MHLHTTNPTHTERDTHTNVTAGEEAEEATPLRSGAGETGEDSAGPDGEARNQGEDIQPYACVEDRGSARPNQDGRKPHV